MKFVKLTEDVGTRRAGEVLELDSGSAASLVEVKKVGEYVASKDGSAERDAPLRGTMSATQIVDADEPSPVSTLDPGPDASAAGDELPLTEGEQIAREDDNAGTEPAQDAAPSTNDSKPELVAMAVRAGIPEAEANSLTKAQLVDKLTS